MTSDDTTGPGDDDNVAGHERGATGDPVRDFLLGVATQIDQLAAVFGGTGQRGAANGFSVDTAALGDLSGEITTLITEIGDLLARLIAALIAVLEAMAGVLRSGPATAPDGTPHYQPISVRIDVTDPSSATRRRQPEGEN
ncbi:hypothetical protein [Gordonia insulae]|uniref:Uncharacterized protein n=1 Tax=Gordonia insulae TaxID=2420509 RepID=A0A3G8JFI0_9ACTN|nr:hypothetical protein [Gordonia insulae]AZG43678.1 hypothetical protein D7316_00247 [Gordonia insulae]